MPGYDQLTVQELKEKLKEQQELFEEVTEERMIILSQRNLHLSSKVVVKYQNELQEIQEKIDLLERLIKSKQA
jgi:polyhydroxyalkanoate synthesis regulator phasin